MRAHTLFLAFLLALGLLVPLAIGLRGCGYYATAVVDRPFHPQYDTLKPSGRDSHGYGIVGALLIIAGVSVYSSRKRFRMLRTIGAIRTFLEVHIFLCLLGPALVLYHTTFKFGGIIAVGTWSMLAVVLSGVIGRYLYTQIPKTLQGQEMTDEELGRESDRLKGLLAEQSGLTSADIDRLDGALSLQGKGRTEGVLKILGRTMLFDLNKQRTLNALRGQFGHLHRSGQAFRDLEMLALRRVVLRRRIALLEHSRRLFHLWHVIHLPFTIVMFVILAVHVGVAVAFGYWWVW